MPQTHKHTHTHTTENNNTDPTRTNRHTLVKTTVQTHRPTNTIEKNATYPDVYKLY